jgi:DNA invertase Pin-like site-specific DNA recombinase
MAKKGGSDMDNRAVGYIRVSTIDQQENGVSMFAQRERIEQYCKLNGLDLLGVESDTGSGKDMKNRPGIRRVIEMAMDGDVKHIVFVKLDRFFRSAIETLNLSKQLDNAGVALHSVNDKIDTKSAIGQLYFQITVAFAEFERNLIAERTKEALAHKKAKGEKIGYRAPLGKKFGEKTNRSNGKEITMVVDNPEEIEAIKAAQNLLKQSLSYRQIAKVLATQGYVSRSGRPYPISTIHRFVNMSLCFVFVLLSGLV